MVNNVTINITDNSKRVKKSKKEKKTEKKKPRKTRKDKGVPRKKVAPVVYPAATQTGTYAYNSPIHLDPPFVEQSKIQLNTLTNIVGQMSSQYKEIETAANDSRQLSIGIGDMIGNLGQQFPSMVKDEVKNHLKMVSGLPIPRGIRSRKPLKEVIQSDTDTDFEISEIKPKRKPPMPPPPPRLPSDLPPLPQTPVTTDDELPNLDETPPLLRRSSSVKERIQEIEYRINPQPLQLPQPLEAEPIQEKERVPTPPNLFEANETIQMLMKSLEPPPPREPSPPPLPKPLTPLPPSPVPPIVLPPTTRVRPTQEAPTLTQQIDQLSDLSESEKSSSSKSEIITEPPKKNLFQKVGEFTDSFKKTPKPPTPPESDSEESVMSMSDVSNYKEKRKMFDRTTQEGKQKSRELLYRYKKPPHPSQYNSLLTELNLQKEKALKTQERFKNKLNIETDPKERELSKSIIRDEEIKINKINFRKNYIKGRKKEAKVSRAAEEPAEEEEPKKRRGRPPGSKNKPKD